MPDSYTFSITNSLKKQIWLLACGLLIVNCLLFLYFALHSSAYKWALSTAIVSFIAAVIGIAVKKYASFFYKMSALGICFGWVKLDYYWLAILFSILFLLGEILTRDTTVLINKTAISLKNLFTKKYSWEDLQNVMLKDGLLTIDFKNNKIFQSEIAEKISLTEEKEFNDFCKKKLVV